MFVCVYIYVYIEAAWQRGYAGALVTLVTLVIKSLPSTRDILSRTGKRACNGTNRKHAAQYAM